MILVPRSTIGYELKTLQEISYHRLAMNSVVELSIILLIITRADNCLPDVVEQIWSHLSVVMLYQIRPALITRRLTLIRVRLQIWWYKAMMG